MNSLRKVYEQKLDRLLDLTCFSCCMMAVYIAYKGGFLGDVQAVTQAGVTLCVTSPEDDGADACSLGEPSRSPKKRSPSGYLCTRAFGLGASQARFAPFCFKNSIS